MIFSFSFVLFPPYRQKTQVRQKHIPELDHFLSDRIHVRLFQVIHESRKLKQARPYRSGLLTCCGDFRFLLPHGITGRSISYFIAFVKVIFGIVPKKNRKQKHCSEKCCFILILCKFFAEFELTNLHFCFILYMYHNR